VLVTKKPRERLDLERTNHESDRPGQQGRSTQPGCIESGAAAGCFNTVGRDQNTCTAYLWIHSKLTKLH